MNDVNSRILHVLYISDALLLEVFKHCGRLSLLVFSDVFLYLHLIKV